MAMAVEKLNVDYKNKVYELNEKLKKITTFKELESLLKGAKEPFDNSLYSKHRGHTAFDFQQGYNPERVYCLIDDGVTVGRSRIKNLWKYYEFR